MMSIGLRACAPGEINGPDRPLQGTTGCSQCDRGWTGQESALKKKIKINRACEMMSSPWEPGESDHWGHWDMLG